MSLEDRHYDRVARYLDGEELKLTPQEQHLAEQIRRQEAALGTTMDLAVPPAAMERARRRMTAQLARPRRWNIRGICAVGAAAAAVMLAVVIHTYVVQPQRDAQLASSQRDLLQWAQPDPQQEDVELSLLTEEVDRLSAEMLASSGSQPSVDMSLDELEQSIEDFWLGDAASAL